MLASPTGWVAISRAVWVPTPHTEGTAARRRAVNCRVQARVVGGALRDVPAQPAGGVVLVVYQV